MASVPWREHMKNQSKILKAPVRPRIHRSVHKHKKHTRAWKTIRTLFLTRLGLIYSEAQRCSRALSALTGGIPKGLLHCLRAAAHSGGDKSHAAARPPPSIHRRLEMEKRSQDSTAQLGSFTAGNGTLEPHARCLSFSHSPPSVAFSPFATSQFF